jgi:hypothetical protein
MGMIQAAHGNGGRSVPEMTERHLIRNDRLVAEAERV